MLKVVLRSDRLQGYGTELNFGSDLSPHDEITLDAAAGPFAIAVSWTEADSATGYYLYRSLTTGTGFTLIATVSGLSYSDETVSSGTEYYYKVRPYNSYGTGFYSNEDHAHLQSIVHQRNFVCGGGSKVWTSFGGSPFTMQSTDSIVCTFTADVLNYQYFAVFGYAYPEGTYTPSRQPPPVRDVTLTQGYPASGSGYVVTDCRPWSMVLGVTLYDGVNFHPPSISSTADGVHQVEAGKVITGFPNGSCQFDCRINIQQGWNDSQYDAWVGTATVYR